MNPVEPRRDEFTPKHPVNEEQETQIEDNLEEEEDIIPSRFSGSVIPKDFDVDGLVKRLRNGDIYIPSFQRTYVWKPKQASRFIESLLLGLPVPGIFLAKERETNKLLVIDGQQRLLSLLYFYEGKFPSSRRAFSLKGVHPDFEGATYKSLSDADRRQLDNSSLSSTVVEQNHSDADDSSIYHIFERLNTGGTLLKPQEIRAAIYHGELNDLIDSLNDNESWRSIFGRTDKNKRDQELILRFLALYFGGYSYKDSMKEFLNNYMSKNRHLKIQSADQVKQAFIPTIEVIYECLGSRAFKPKTALNAAIFDAVMVGLARRLEKGSIKNLEQLRFWYQVLLNEKNFIAASTVRTSNEGNVRLRLQLTTDAFVDLE
ncbi:DUF262 domain-containing protein [Allocoleopsis sp.]|uniref:DUF262 domain-containing protein n=1 Tax=Allocoleopsis sp. TaxID=3088169 RepID=UPI002FD6D58B